MDRRIEHQFFGRSFVRAFDIELEAGRPVFRERVEHPGNLTRNTGAHQHIVHTSEHRTVQRREIRHLHLREQIDAHITVVSLFREPDLHEVREHGELLTPPAHDAPVHGQQLVCNIASGCRHEILLEHLVADA